MSFLLWRRESSASIGSDRRVLRAAEVPLLADADAVCERLTHLHAMEAARIEAAVRDARESARLEGLEIGRREGAAAVAALLLRIETDAARARDRLRADVAALAIEVVRKIAAGVAADALLAALAETAARELLPATTLTLAVHPAQADAVRARLAPIPGEPRSVRLEVAMDPDCAVESCRIETEHGTVDASLEAQLGRLAAAWGVALAPEAP